MNQDLRRKFSGVIVLIALVLGGATSCTEGERTIEYDGFVLTESPSESPRVFPYGFIYPESVPAMSGVYTESPYASTREGVMIFHTNDELALVQAYYLKKFEERGWQIIQSQERENEVLLLAENLSRRLFTVILRSSVKNPNPAGAVEIKMYIKQAGLR